MTDKNKRGLGLKRRLQEANDEERAILRDGLPYAVGFAKPPVHGQFKKGKSGNGRGRPKGLRTWARSRSKSSTRW